MPRFTLALAALCLFAAPARADDPAPAADGRRQEAQVLVAPGAEHGGWGAPVVQVSTIRGRSAVLVGGRGGWLLDHRITIGGGGFGLASDIPAPAALQRPGSRYDLSFGYGGLWLEYTVQPLRLVHLSIGTLVAGGGLSLRHHGDGDVGDEDDAVFVLDPAVSAEVNLMKHVRAGIGAGYRWISGVQMAGVSNGDLRGFSFIAALKFGKF